MKLIVLYLSMLCVGYFVASRQRDNKEKFRFASSLMMSVVYVLVLIMGMKMGINEQVTSNLGVIGLQSLMITVFCVGGSMLAVFAARKVLGMDRYGNLVGKGGTVGAAESHAGDGAHIGEYGLSEDSRVTEEYSASEDHSASGAHNASEGHSASGNSDLKSTLIILALVVVGMAAGCFGLAKYIPEYLQQFDDISGDVMVVLLCGLLFLVGLDMGLSGNVISSIRRAGARVMVFPFAVLVGSLVVGSASAMVFGFSMKEGLAICAGFGWYTYAPTVIAEAGAQHIVASAVSFMHNVIRETSGIILIPIIAKRFGYIESAAVPGVAAMDICMPIVERSCRQDTAVYSFTIGITLSILASVLVPLFMSL